jgi:hypothetical protein
MGRPPIGAKAMTAAEKQRRYRARKAGDKLAVTKPGAGDCVAEARALIGAMTPAERFAVALYAVAGLEDWRQPHFAHWYNDILMRDRSEEPAP